MLQFWLYFTKQLKIQPETMQVLDQCQAQAWVGSALDWSRLRTAPGLVLPTGTLAMPWPLRGKGKMLVEEDSTEHSGQGLGCHQMMRTWSLHAPFQCPRLDFHSLNEKKKAKSRSFLFWWNQTNYHLFLFMNHTFGVISEKSLSKSKLARCFFYVFLEKFYNFRIYILV